MAGTSEAAGDNGFPGIDLERTAAFLADQYAILYEERPQDPRASISGDVLTFTFAGGLSRSDEWLLRSGREREVRDFREHFLHAAVEQFETVVRVLTGSAVVSSSNSFDAGSRVTNCRFVLREDRDREVEERQAILAWSEQVRRNAKDLRARHVEAREAHERLRRLIRDLREEASESDDA